MLDTQRVEVLRGPQGTLYGQGSTGGTIRFLANNPTFDGVNGEIGTSFYTTQGGDMSSEVSAITNIPVVDDTLAFRVAARYKDVGGWMDQPEAGKDDINDSQTSYLRIKGLWQASDELTVNAMVLRSRGEVGARNASNVKGVNSDAYYYRQIGPNDMPLLSTGVDNQSDIYNLTLSYDFGFATLTSSSSKINILNDNKPYSVRVSQEPNINSGFLILDFSNDIEGFSQEIRLGGTTQDNQFDWVFGAFYADSEWVYNSDGFGSYSDGVVGSSRGANGFVRGSKSTALFTHVSYHVNEKVTLEAGARYFEDDRSFDNAPRPEDVTVSRKGTFDHVSPKISLSYALNNDASVYVSVAEGFRSGGFNARAQETFEPETVRTYEVGAKALLLGGRLKADTALFYTQYEDFQAVDLIDNRAFITNPGAVDIEGIEFSAQFNVSEQLSVGASGHYINTEYVKISKNFSRVNIGDPLNWVPKYSVAFNTKLNFDGPLSSAGFVLLDYSVQAGSFATLRPVLKWNPILFSY